MTTAVACPSHVYLGAAADIADRLVAEAIWHEHRCNWIGALPSDQRTRHGDADVAFGSLGADLYLGTSGVALFLAQLYAAEPRAALRETAQGAIRQALDFPESGRGTNRLGLFSGWLGIAFAAARVAALLNDDELLPRAANLVQRALAEGEPERDFDVLSGKAGAIVALLALAQSLPRRSLVDAAVRMGDTLLGQAERCDAGWSWSVAAAPGAQNLTGFSHGAAGAAYALLELFRATGDARFRHGAEEAFRYERHWFDADAGNWPDFRGTTARRARTPSTSPCSAYWCHGAPGIALSRLRAFRLLGDPVCAAEARIALKTTRDAVETMLRSGTAAYALCHGLCGNVDALLYGREVLGTSAPDVSALAYRVADEGIERYGEGRAPWPCGLGAEETPGLMLGLAGIGHFYLRLADPGVRPVVIVETSDGDR